MCAKGFLYISTTKECSVMAFKKESYYLCVIYQRERIAQVAIFKHFLGGRPDKDLFKKNAI